MIIWDIRTRKKIIEFQEHASPVTCITFHPFEFLLAAGRNDGTVDLYDLEKQKLISRTDANSPFNGHTVKCITFSENGECCFVGSAEGISVIGWEPDKEFDHIESAWSILGDMKVVNKKLVSKQQPHPNASKVEANSNRFSIIRSIFPVVRLVWEANGRRARNQFRSRYSILQSVEYSVQLQPKHPEKFLAQRTKNETVAEKSIEQQQWHTNQWWQRGQITDESELWYDWREFWRSAADANHLHCKRLRFRKVCAQTWELFVQFAVRQLRQICGHTDCGQWSRGLVHGELCKRFGLLSDEK